ncbi:MAG: twitching motility protein [Acidimicrobiaceae bacterium]|jgi:twitching motility protein PilT|nr:twitching motility protein [Acidimicrobiaceae bacterium]
MDQLDLNRMLGRLVEMGGSDLHVKAGSPPRARLNGTLSRIPEEAAIDGEDMASLAREIMHDRIWSRFESTFEADFAYSVPQLGRFRVNAFRQRGTVSMVFRHVRPGTQSLAELGLPDAVRRLAEEPRGIVLVTGPTGCGKTTTLAAMIDHLNNTRECHVVTIEDPIEVLHRDNLASISQREIGFDTESFIVALRSALREDPDVILVGEMRDPETVETALTAAETGHLVLSTLHTGDSVETINRIIDFFPPSQQRQARLSLASALRGTICQRLIPTIDGKERVPALEIMVVNGRIQQCIVEPVHTSNIADIIAEGDYYGMQTFAQSLIELLKEGLIDAETAISSAPNSHDLRIMLQRQGMAQSVLG